MSLCPVCNTENDDFAITCIHCRGYLQNRVPNLNLFDTLWLIIENPQKAFRLITLADHKNYAFTLFAFFGIGLTFALVWFFKIGDHFDSLLQLIVYCFIIGIFLGIGIAPLSALIQHILAKIFRRKGGYKNFLAITAYALTPILLTVIFILPIELLTFGSYLFSFNPSPMSLKPLLYSIFIGIDSLCALWTIILLVTGIKISQQTSLVTSVAICFIFVSIFLLTIYWGSINLLYRIV